MRIGVICGHPDDETLGMGGTLASLAKQHHIVHLLILGDGVMSRPGATLADVRLRRSQTTQAVLALGAHCADVRALRDNAFDQTALLTIVQLIEEWAQRILPEIVYTHSLADLNIDHRITAQAVLTATRPTPGQTVRELYAFEVPSSTEWGFGQLGRFNPSVFVDITATIDTKLAAMACYETELRPFPHPRSPEAIRARAQYWGSVAGLEYAEAFELIRRVDGR